MSQSIRSPILTNGIEKLSVSSRKNFLIQEERTSGGLCCSRPRTSLFTIVLSFSKYSLWFVNTPTATTYTFYLLYREKTCKKSANMLMYRAPVTSSRTKDISVFYLRATHNSLPDKFKYSNVIKSHFHKIKSVL